MKKTKYKRVYIFALLAAVLLFAQGCGKETNTEPIYIIGFEELDAEGLASWRPEGTSLDSVDGMDSSEVSEDSVGTDEPETEETADSGESAEDEMTGLSQLENLSQHELLELFKKGEIPAYCRETEENAEQIYINPFYITNMFDGKEAVVMYAQLDDDEEEELVIKGPYGGEYLDTKDGVVYVMAYGQGTACELSYAEYDGKVWLVYSDTTHGGRVCYQLFRMDDAGTIVEEFSLDKFYWDYPKEPDGPNTVYEYSDEQISKEEYDEILSQIKITSTFKWYGE